jgi:hypothetical protein
MRSKTRRKLRKSRIKKRFTKGEMRLSVTVESWFLDKVDVGIKREGTMLRRNYGSVHSLTILKSLGIKIENLCGKKFRREAYIQRKMMKGVKKLKSTNISVQGASFL